ncbi:MFS transporter [Acuticoccus sediminis]|uniref:MFS transporter n=1 Tax=Acuticoccus sediminis TaxID=2184697 RepID=A0A8B2NJY9_9HYPH|nr:RsmB/NOP family class I SAM-dependent RNA methyltransferase [Acuticoccus sediminis]RAH99944.1 MFS transporter [Acuticoccus sediminis]
MRPAGRIAAAIEVLADVETRHRPVADALKDWGLSHRFAGSGDRAAIGNLVYDVLRWRRSSAWRAGADTPRAATLATLRFHWGVGPADLETLATEEHGPGALTEEERAALSADRLGDAPPDVAADVPDWLAPAFEDNFGDDWVNEAASLAARAPVDLRVNTLKSDRAKVLSALKRFGATASPISPVGVRLPARAGWERSPNIVREDVYQRGHVEVQDIGSQAAALMVLAHPGEQILDLCAGAGGKTLALAAQMDNRGQLHATDADQNQLAPIFERLKRAGVRNAQVHRAGSDLSALEGRMDKVLVDAPCSGSGTWRRRPETKWRLTPEALERRTDQQAAVLDQARAFVRPGGTLIYVTCSVLPQENEAQIADFLDRAADFTLTSMADAWVDIAGEDAPMPWSAEGLMMTMTPAATGTDGFFVAALKRTG